MKGLVVGKFMPPHVGHEALIHFAAGMCDHLYVVIGHRNTYRIDVGLRARLLAEIAREQNVTIVPIDETRAGLSEKNWDDKWRAAILFECGRIDRVFSGDGYGAELAALLKAEFVPFPGMRDAIPINATGIRAHPFVYWNWMAMPARRHFQKRVLIYGPESVGKTTMAQTLAQRYGCACVREFARGYLEARPGPCRPEYVVPMMQGQRALFQAMSRGGAPLVFCDTDAASTYSWAKEYFGRAPEVDEFAYMERYDLLLVLDDAVPFTPDPIRYGGDRREISMEQVERILGATESKRCATISGTDWQDRTNQAVAHVDATIAEGLA